MDDTYSDKHSVADIYSDNLYMDADAYNDALIFPPKNNSDITYASANDVVNTKYKVIQV